MPIRACNSPPLRQDIASPCANVSNAGGLYSAGTVRLPSALNKNAPVASTHAHKNLPAGGHRLIQHVVCVRAEIYGLAQLVFKNRSCGGSHLYLRPTVAAASRPEAAPGVTSFCMASFGKKTRFREDLFWVDSGQAATKTPDVKSGRATGRQISSVAKMLRWHALSLGGAAKHLLLRPSIPQNRL